MTIKELEDIPIFYTNEGCKYQEYIGVIEVEPDKYLIIEESLRPDSESQLFQMTGYLSRVGLNSTETFKDSELYYKLKPLFDLLN